jgi:hypothetical protein
MTTIPPTAAPILPAVVAAAAGPVVVIPQPPPEILKLPPGSTIETVVLARQQQTAESEEARQTLILRTAAGDVTVRTAVPLDDGARVALEVLRTASNQVTARVVTIDDVPAKQALAQSGREAPTPTATAPLPDKLAQTLTAQRAPILASGQAWTPAGPVAITSVQPLSAYVLKTATLPLSAPPTSLNSFLPGSDLGIRIVSVQTAPGLPATAPSTQPPAAIAAPQPTPQASTTTMLLGQPNANPPSIATPSATPTTAPATQAPTNPVAAAPNSSGTQNVTTRPPGIVTTGLAVTPTSTSTIANPNATTPNSAISVATSTTETPGLKLPTVQGLGAPTPTPPQSVESSPIVARMTGQVTSIASNGAAVVQTAAGDMQLNVRANLPVGTILTFEVLTTAPPRADGQLAPPVPSPLGLPLSTPTVGWGALTEALQILQRTDPQAAVQLVSAIPDGGPRSAVATMAFMQAMRSGDARQWPGDTALRGLERAGPRGAQLAAQISGEVREMAARTAEGQSEWRTTPMPWNLDGKIERVNLVTRREETGEDEADGKKKSGKGKGTRFLINLDLSRLGEMQLDGMFVKSTRAFDLMIRTKDALPEDMRRDLSGLFATSNAAMGLKGALSFQVVKKFADPTNSAGVQNDRGGVWA